MRLRSELTVEQIKEMLREVLEYFKDKLIEELREGTTQPVAEPEPNDPLMRRAEVCLRWGRSRTTISKLVKAKKLVPGGKIWAFVYVQDFGCCGVVWPGCSMIVA